MKHALSVIAVRATIVAVLLCGWPRPASAAETLATYEFTPGWATFGLALPEGVAESAVQVGTLPTQTDVKVTWLDRSIRFAVVTVHIPTAGAYAITAASRAAARFVPRVLPHASVTLTIDGRPFVATLPGSLGDSWLSGPLVSEGRAVIAPGGHPSLRVIFDVRSYSGGGDRVDITVENCLDVSTADQVRYDVAVHIGSNAAPAFSRASVLHKYLARWRKTFATGGLGEAAVRPDMAPFVAARAVPEYMPSVDRPPRPLAGAGRSGTGFDILAFGELTLPMDAHGGRPEIAPYPDWTAQYLVHRKTDQRAFVLRHGELGGSWGIHIRKPNGSMPTIDEFPGYWLDPRWKDDVGLEGPSNVSRRKASDGTTYNYIPGRAERGDLAHQPSLAFVPYLITGDRFFAEETAFWANFCLIGTFAASHARNGSEGSLLYNEVRGIGWALRNIGDAAAYLPDNDPLKTYFANKTWTNLSLLERYAATFDAGPLQTLFPRRRPEDDNPRYAPYAWVSLWEQTYAAWAVDRVMQHGQVTRHINLATAGATFRNRIAKLQLNLFTDPGWPRDHLKQAPYLLAAGQWSSGPGSTLTFFQTFAEMSRATFSAADPGQPPDLVRPFPGYYGPEARLLLMICEQLGLPGAVASYNRVMSDAVEGVTMVDDLKLRSGWAIRRTPPAS